MKRSGILFTPPTSPWILSSIKVMASYTLGNAKFRIEIWDGDQKELFQKTYMYADYLEPNDPPRWATIELPDIPVKGSFYVCFFGNFDNASDDKSMLGADHDPPVSGRSFAVKYDPNKIDYMCDWNWMIRATGDSPDPN